ncbi:MAG TPA: porin [Ramlibacter sp.]|uniref:porin n=1 Tax=Ramlibacter sp. TaxID=1917967 RepID=UPI002CB6DF0E|nr:porin [Ramlibacter sp.]HVZ43461.1 porin [Ramlibacter sp.]
MRRRTRELLLAALVACPLPALAQDSPAWLEFYFNLYPEYKVQHFDSPVPAGTNVGTMGTLRNDTTVLSRAGSAKAQIEGQEWSNSYIGVRGQFARGPFTGGYDVQGLIDFAGHFDDNFRTRDAFVWIGHERFGRLAYGKMDTMYKEAGDPVRMFGISSSNIVSTAKVQSGVGWKGAGETSFNNRVDHQLAWVGPGWGGWNLSVSEAVRAVDTANRLNGRLFSAAAQWRSGPWYAALATEIHHDWLPVSFVPATPVPAATSIRNALATTHSRDQGWRLSGAWVEGPWRIGADVARLRYTEDDSVSLPGKFRSYANYTGQVSAEYRLGKKLRFGANHARATAGECALSGGVPCSTHGLGGEQTSLGVLLSVSEIASVFLIMAHTHNGPAAQYGSSAQGATTNAYALGIKLSMK